MTNNSLIHIHNATIKQGGDIIIENVHWTIKPGEQWAVTGMAGSGKTSLLNLLNGTGYLSAGNIERPLLTHIAAQNTTTYNGIPGNWHQLVVMSGTKFNLKDNTNTATNLYYQQRYNATESDSVTTVELYLQQQMAVANPGFWNVENVPEYFNLTHLQQRHLIKLSNGETRRLLLAAAVIKNPVLLLADNPFAGLDKNARQYFTSLLETIAQKGTTIVMTAAMDEIPAFINQVAIIKNKQLHKVSNTPVALKNYTETIDAAIDMNLLRQMLSGYQPATEQALIELKNIHIQYGENKILQGIHWKIFPGERWVLSGENGAGKTTLLSLINADNPQGYANDITLFGRKKGTGESIWDIKKHIGFVSAELFQYFPTDNNCLQVIESGYYETIGLFRASQPAKQAVALQWMQLLKIDQYRLKPFKNVPAAVQRLCLLARALVKQPSLLILDEPCQGFDVQLQEYFKKIIDYVCLNSPIALIYVNHHEEEWPESITHSLVLSKGQVAYCGKK